MTHLRYAPPRLKDFCVDELKHAVVRPISSNALVKHSATPLEGYVTPDLEGGNKRMALCSVRKENTRKTVVSLLVLCHFLRVSPTRW